MPIILIPGGAGDDVESSLFSAFLQKPFTSTRLVEAVKDAVGTRE